MICEACQEETRVRIGIGGMLRCLDCARKFTDRGYGLTSELQARICELEAEVQRLKGRLSRFERGNE